MKFKTTLYKNFTITGSHRNRQSWVNHRTIRDEYGEELLYVIEREQDEFLGRPAGFSYFVRTVSRRYPSFIAESWGEVISKLNETIA
jgi:hypothetical protein